MESETLSEFFEETANFSSSAASPDDIFSVLEAWENASSDYKNHTSAADAKDGDQSFEFQKVQMMTTADGFQISETTTTTELEAASPTCKRQKLMINAEEGLGQQRNSHITVERNRRKQMNGHLSVLRSLMPCFYVKRGDQASIIGGVVDYINELQQVLQSLEAKKQRKAANYINEAAVLSPRLSVPISPRVISSPRLSLPISPRTPQPSSPYKPWISSLPSPVDPSPCSNSSSTASSININNTNDAVVNELVATSKSALAEVEVKFSGSNLLLKTVSPRIPGQVTKIISAIEELALEILHVSITAVDETMLNSFTIKIGIQCQLSAQDLADQIQHTFC